MAAAIWLETAGVAVSFSEKAAVRARELVELGFGNLDALHTAFAEDASARWLVTTDDQLIALGQRHRAALRIEITGPIRLIDTLPGDEP